MTVFGKRCHFPLELKYKAMWEINKLNFDFQDVKEKRLLQMTELVKPMTMSGSTKMRPRNGMTRGY